MRLTHVRLKPMHIALLIASVLYLIAGAASGREGPAPSARGTPAVDPEWAGTSAGAAVRPATKEQTVSPWPLGSPTQYDSSTTRAMLEHSHVREALRRKHSSAHPARTVLLPVLLVEL